MLKQALFLIPAKGKLERVRLVGDRSDPMNLFNFGGTVANVIRALDPSITSKEAVQLAFDLGIMRGDADPTIGEEKLTIKPKFAATCISQASTISTKIDCKFVPRF